MNNAIYSKVRFTSSFTGNFSQISSFIGFTNKQQIESIAIANTKGGNIIEQNSMVGILKYEYRYKFWGLPNGVTIPPRFAEMFCNINRYGMYFSCFATVIEK